MKHLLGKKAYTEHYGKTIGTIVCVTSDSVTIAYNRGTVKDGIVLSSTTIWFNNESTLLDNITEYYGLEYDSFYIYEITLAEKYVPNTKIFRLLYPEAEVYQKKFLKIELK